MQVEQKDLSLFSEWIGTLDGLENAEIKSQVAGYLIAKNYVEGTFVKKGQLMFTIDPRPFQAVVEQTHGDLAKAEAQVGQANSQLLQSQAQLAQAEANQGKAQLDVERYTPLAKEKAVSDQDLANAVQANLAAQAQVKVAQAGVESAKAAIVAAKASVTAVQAMVKTAELNLSFTQITAPIDGIAGISQAQIGNLIQPNNPNSGALTTVSTVDPIKVYFTVSEKEYFNLLARPDLSQRQADAAGKKLELQLILVDDTVYPHKGKLLAADRQVDVKTGSIRLLGTFPNPGFLLRPGQYARIRAVTRVEDGALLVPQRAITELQGSYQVAVVDRENKVRIQPVRLGERVGSMCIVENGLRPGDRVVAEGTQKVRPDMLVVPKPYAVPASAAAHP